MLNGSPNASSLNLLRKSKRSSRFWASVLAAGFAAGVIGCQHPRDPDVVATVNGKPILRSEMELRYQQSLGDSHQQTSQVQADIVRLKVVQDLIDHEILIQRAAKLNLTANDEEVQSKLDEIKAPYTGDQFSKWLDQQHLTLDKLKEDIRRGKTEEKLFNKEINSKINITDADIGSYYNAHKTDYDVPEPQYHLAEIVVTSIAAAPQQTGNLQNSKATTDAEAKRKIEMIRNRIASGEDFGMLAANFSENPDNAQSGGDMGFVPESKIKVDPLVYTAITKLNPGQVTDVMPLYLATPGGKKQVGYAVYRLLDKEAAGQHDLSDPRVQQSIRTQLREARSQLLQNAYIEMLQDQAHVVNYYAEQIFRNGAQ